MSLFSALQIANQTLRTAQTGLHVAGNNIANANTPGYLREEMVLEAAPTQRVGNLLLGTGVRVLAVKQRVDAFLEDRLRGAESDLSGAEAQENAYMQLEALMGELSDTDLSTSLTSFFGSINDILNQPESASIRNLAMLQGRTLAQDINRLDARVRQIRSDVNNQVGAMADDINRLLERVAKLNVQIVTTEGGKSTPSDAVGLRDQRLQALSDLAKLIDVKAVEQPSGNVNVYVGGEFVVFDGIHRPVEAVVSTDRSLGTFEIRLAETDNPLNVGSGKLAGLIAARDEILGGFTDELNSFARSLAFEFNKIYSSGQGLTGFDTLTSEAAVTDIHAPLDAAGLSFTPVNGSFKVLIRDKQTGVTQTTDILVPLNGLEGDLSLDDLADAFDAIDGLEAQITSDRRLKLTSESANLEFSFADDTSGVLAALGINTFFTGDSASQLGVSQVVQRDPSKFAVSGGGMGEDSATAERLASLLDKPLASLSGGTLAESYDRMAGEVSQRASVATSVAEGFRVFQKTLDGQKLGTSGVSLDEEAIRMISYQRLFQASARFVSTISEILDVLVNL